MTDWSERRSETRLGALFDGLFERLRGGGRALQAPTIALALSGAIVGAIVGAGPAFAQGAPLRAEEIARLAASLRLEEMLDVVIEEELGFGEELRADMLPDLDARRWRRDLRAVLTPDGLAPVFMAAFSQALAEGPQVPLATLSNDPLMVKAVDLELKARRLLLDPAVEAAAIERAAQAGEEPRYQALDAHIEALDLIEANVAGSLNSNLIFYRELVRGGAFPYSVSEQEMLADVAGETEDLRFDIAQWLTSYLYMAYAPLSEAEFAGYVALRESEAGRALYRAADIGFDAIFARNSKVLGAMVAARMVGEDL